MSENRHPHLWTLHRQYPFRYIENIPSWISPYICKCDQFDYSFAKGIRDYPALTPSNWPLKCGTCSRYNVYLLFVCVDCDEAFIKDFKHPRFCTFEHFRCWDCLNNYLANDEDGVCCDRVTWHIAEERVLPPVGVKVRRFSDEEIASVLDEPFTIT